MCRDGGDPVEPFRELCGPADPEIATALRPQSLRARFGSDKNRNGVHCTDLQARPPTPPSWPQLPVMRAGRSSLRRAW